MSKSAVDTYLVRNMGMFVSVATVALACLTLFAGRAYGLASSQHVALVPNAHGRTDFGGTLPTSGFPDGYQPVFTDVDPAAIGNTENLASYDTVVLVGMCDIGSDVFLGNPAWNTTIRNFVSNGGKLIIWDSECQNTDYSKFVVPFVTNNPGQLGANGALGISEDNSLARQGPVSHPRFIDANLIGTGTDGVGDANVFTSFDQRWCVHLRAINAAIGAIDGLPRPTHTYAGTASNGTFGGLGAGLIIYSGFDKDYLSDSVGFGTTNGPQNLARVWLFELLQPFNPDNLLCTVTALCGNGTVDPAEECDPTASPTGCESTKNCNVNLCVCETPPVCGDGFIDPPELCDPKAVPSGCTSALPVCNPGSCVCEDPTCGNGQVEAGEDCDGASNSECPGQCLPLGDPNACRCPQCGDDVINQPSEECDGIDRGQCLEQCGVPGTDQACKCLFQDPGRLLYRIQLKTRSCDVSEAESGDSLFVSLHEDHKVFLNRPVKDLARNAIRLYEVLPADLPTKPKINSIDDIKFLELGKDGSDGWCLQRLELIVNGLTVFTRSYPRGLFLDNGNGESNTLFVSRGELEASPEWQQALKQRGTDERPQPTRLIEPVCRILQSKLFTISPDYLKGLVEGFTAQALRTQLPSFLQGHIDWNDDKGALGDAVELKGRADGLATSIDLDLEGEIPGHPAVDVDFDLRWSCAADGSLTITPENVDVDLPDVLLIGGPPKAVVIELLVSIIEELIEQNVEGQLRKQIQLSFSFPTLSCRIERVDPDGSVAVRLSGPICFDRKLLRCAGSCTGP